MYHHIPKKNPSSYMMYFLKYWITLAGISFRNSSRSKYLFIDISFLLNVLGVTLGPRRFYFTKPPGECWCRLTCRTHWAGPPQVVLSAPKFSVSNPVTPFMTQVWILAKEIGQGAFPSPPLTNMMFQRGIIDR